MKKFKQISVILLVVLLPLAIQAAEISTENRPVSESSLHNGLPNNVTNKSEIEPSTSAPSSVTSSASKSTNDLVGTSDQTPNLLVQAAHNATSSPIAPSLANEKSGAENGEIKIDVKPINAVHLAVSESIRPTNESKTTNDLSIGSSWVELHIHKPTNVDANSSSISANSASPAESKPSAGPSTTTSNLATNQTSLSDRSEALNASTADRSSPNNESHRSIDLSSHLTVNLTDNHPANSSVIRKADNLPASSTIDETKVLDSRSTNEEDEFDEFEKDEAKKEDESSIIENDKASNKVEGGGQPEKTKENKGDDERSTPKSISNDKKYGETDTANEDEEDDEFANSSNPPNSSTNLGGSTNSSTNLSDSGSAKKAGEPANSTQPADDSEHEDDEEDEPDEEVHTTKKVPANQANGKRQPGERERASLNKLQSFLQNTVELALKSALPELVKSGYETNLSPSCQNSFLAVTRGLQGTRQWAYKMLDSSGKPPSGILEGTLTDFGAFEQCLSVDTRIEQPDENNHFTGKYCILDVKPAFDVDIPLGSQPPAGIRNDSVLWAPSLQIFWSRNSLLSFRYGLCVPSACSDHDLQTLATYFFKPTGMVAEVGFCQLNTEQHADTLQILIIFALSVIILTVFIGSVLEVSLKRLDKQQLLTSNKKSLVDFLICFSIIKNTRRLLNVKNKRNPAHNSQLKHLDAVRFLSTCWIIMGHTYFYTDFVHYHHFRSLAHFKYLDDNFFFMPIANFTLSVETYFFISGLLVVYANWSKLKSSNGKINILDFLVHRVWRIWPPYLVVIACTLILPLFGSGPLWPESVKNTATVCRKSWFYNILFINNFQKPDEVCLFHTWFLAANIQFHLAAIPLLFVLYRYPKLCFGICGAAIMGCIGWVFHYAHINDLTIPAVIADDVFVDFDQNILTLYILPLYHLGSYLLGMILGYILITKTPKVLPAKLQLTFWSLCFAMLAIVIFLPHHSFQGEPTSLLFSCLYLSLHRIVWSLAFGWIVYACSTGQGGFINSILSYEAFTALSSLSYLAYLIHPILMLYHTGMVRERVQLSHYQLLNTFLARVILAFSSAYVLYVMVELPFANIEKYLFPAAARKRQKAAIDQADSRKPPATNNVENAENNIGNNPKGGHYYQQFNQQQMNQQPLNNQQYFNTIGALYPNKSAHQLGSPYHQLANQKRVINDYYASSMSRQFANGSNFKEKHHLNMGNQRRIDRQYVERQSNEKHLTDRQLIDKRQALDRQQHLNRMSKHPYPYLSEQDKKYLPYRQGLTNQYYFYTGSGRTNCRPIHQQSSNLNQQPINSGRSKELSKEGKVNAGHRTLLDESESQQQSQVVSTNFESTVTVTAGSATGSPTTCSLNVSSLETTSQCKQAEETTNNDLSTADTQLTSATLSTDLACNLSSNTLSSQTLSNEATTVDVSTCEANQASSEPEEEVLCERC